MAMSLAGTSTDTDPDFVPRDDPVHRSATVNEILASTPGYLRGGRLTNDDENSHELYLVKLSSCEMLCDGLHASSHS